MVVRKTHIARVMWCIGLVVLLGCEPQKTKVVQPDWSTLSQVVLFDHHSHTRSSDGMLTVEQLVALAETNGCDAIAISDHSDSAAAYSVQHLAQIDAARVQYPSLLVFAGLELEMPSYLGREHLGFVVHPALERTLVPKLGNAIAPPYSRNSSDQDALALAVIAEFAPNPHDALLFYNHPSRKDPSADENLDDFTTWSSSASRNLIFSVAPGHQAALEPGDYKPPLLTIDRWDPVVAQIGGTWDQLLDSGEQVWGAIAASDYHNGRKDYAPCSFAKTHVQAQEKTYSAALKSLDSGLFWAGHGNILRELSLSAEFSSTSEVAYAGASVDLAEDEKVAVVSVTVKREKASAGLPLSAEIISNCIDGFPRSHAVLDLDGLARSTQVFLPIEKPGQDGTSCYVRARVATTRSGERLFAYTNPIRFFIP